MAETSLERTNGAGATTAATAHGEGCACTRCAGFEPGNAVAARHGSYSVVGLAGRAREVADALRETMVEAELWKPAFGPTIEACAVVLVRLERAEAALEQIDDAAMQPLSAYIGENAETLARLRQDARGWANTARGYLNDLGLSPASLARIARDSGIGKAARASVALRALEEHVAREYGDTRGGEGTG